MGRRLRHEKPTRARAWRAPGSGRRRTRPFGALTAFIFNLALLTLPLAGAAALLTVARDHLYAYDFTEAGARAMTQRIERLNGEVIQLDFDRLRQWDDLIAMELMAGDVPAARGFLLSARGMLPRRYANQINRQANGGGDDAALELAALELLTPGTRARYEANVPLLSRRAASGAGERITTVGAVAPVLVAGQEDFELLAASLLQSPESDPLHFILTGYSLGLAGEFNPRTAAGAAALLTASRRADYSPEMQLEMSLAFSAVAPPLAFSSAALADAELDQASSYENASAAFRAALNPARAEEAREILDEIGGMSEATSPASAVELLTHARSLSDLPRLRLAAQAAGDRAAAAAKRLPRDGRLIDVARGELTITRDLAASLGVAFLAFVVLVGILGLRGYQLARRWWLRMRREREEYGAELIDFSNNWRPL